MFKRYQWVVVGVAIFFLTLPMSTGDDGTMIAVSSTVGLGLLIILIHLLEGDSDGRS